MRVTAEAKIVTRQRILEAATSLFKADGWQNTTTRGIAVAAGIATGTLFNYFPTKEAIAAALIAEALGRAGEEFSAIRSEEGSLEADSSRSSGGASRTCASFANSSRRHLKPSSARWRVRLPTALGTPSASITWNWWMQP